MPLKLSAIPTPVLKYVLEGVGRQGSPAIASRAAANSFAYAARLNEKVTFAMGYRVSIKVRVRPFALEIVGFISVAMS